MKDYMTIYKEWLDNPYFDEATKEELRGIAGDENEIKERFYMDLEFGTAGLRGIIGAGINRMNIYTVRRATQGLANYIIKQGGADKGVAIAFDSRRMSPEFADEAARTLAANGIKAYRFETLRPTPELSFAVRELGCIAGINITASHNPPEYNVKVSASVTADMEGTEEEILTTQSQMELLKESMQKISDMSMAIEKIIGEINSIAEQTNMLSLNASIEAARAGERGKGFAVVATQVGELATRSAQAAKETNELITNSMKAVEDGKGITNETVEAFKAASENIGKANRNVEKITYMVRRNVSIVMDAVSQIERISGVVEENVQISQNTKEVSANMADVAGKLIEIVEA